MLSFARPLICLLLLALPVPAGAVQAHGGAEGLVSHQLGHLLLTCGLLYMLLRLHRLRKQNNGWGDFRLFLWLLIGWNLLTFLGHWLNEHIARAKFLIANGHTLSFQAETFVDLLYYLTRLDHLLLLPAFCFLFCALRKWGQQ